MILAQKILHFIIIVVIIILCLLFCFWIWLMRAINDAYKDTSHVEECKKKEKIDK